MDFALRVRLVIGKPADHWLSEEPVKDGYWGFVRCKEDYEGEKSVVCQQIEGLISDLRKEGMKIEFLPEIEIQNLGDVLKNFDELKKTAVNIILGISPLEWCRPEMCSKLVNAIASASKYIILFDKFGPNIYAGTLFTPPAYQFLKRHHLVNRVFQVEGDERRLKTILRSVYALEKISSAKLVCVGPINAELGGWSTLKRSIELFGHDVRFYTYDEFARDFKKFYEDKNKQQEARKIIEDFVSKSTEVVEPTEEKLLRAGIYYLVLKKYIEENKADWITVNCLSELVEMTKATPCMAFSIFNDSGIVATCEADPAAMGLQYLIRYISGKPVFFHDPTVNEKDGTLILAHCTSPTKLLGFDKPNFPYQVRTHHESNYGATPKPTFKEGEVTVAGFSFDLDKMLIVRGRVMGTPDLRICRSQVEVKVNNASQILENWQGFHWVLVYGDYTEELKAICKMKGITPLVYE